MASASATVTGFVEQCWVLVGQRRGRVWHGRRVRPTRGEAVRVAFDGPWVLEREERRGDVLGFYHTHPDGLPEPSDRDVRTMRAWCGAFGKPLWCVIESPQGIAGFRFDGERSRGRRQEMVELFPRRTVIGVDGDGEQVSS